jgi:hypothetical protein
VKLVEMAGFYSRQHVICSSDRTVWPFRKKDNLKTAIGVVLQRFHMDGIEGDERTRAKIMAAC